MMRKSSLCYRIPLLLALLVLSSCGSTDLWFGDKEDDALPGTRYAVLGTEKTLEADPGMESVQVDLPEARRNADWPQNGGNPAHVMHHLDLSDAAEKRDTSTVGKGYDWHTGLVPSPVVQDGKLFAMDAHGFVSAHDAHDIDTQLWRIKATNTESDLVGGGLAAEEGRLFVALGDGEVVALEKDTGKEVWRKNLVLPIRSAPRVARGMVFVVTLTNQLFALNARDGRILWQHRGISETTGLLGAATPALLGPVLIVPYSSGEMYGLDATSGREAWSEALVLAQNTSPVLGLSDIDADPVASGGKVLAIGHSGVLAALDIGNGRRLWEQEVSSTQSPWIAEDFAFLISSQGQLVCLYMRDGRIKWAVDLPGVKDENTEWSGPVVAGGKVWAVSDEGTLAAFSPEDGKVLTTLDVPDDVTTSPIVADGVMYLVTKDATLVALY